MLRRTRRDVTHGDAENRRRLAIALARSGDARSVPIALEVMPQFDGSSPGRELERAILDLGTAAVEPLVEVLASRRGPTGFAADLLTQLAPVSIPALVRSLQDRRLRSHAIRALAEAEASDATVADALITLLRSTKNRRTREEAIWALGRNAHPSALNELMVCADSPRAEERATACFALGGLEDHRAVDCLCAALDDSEERVRQCALFALEKLRDERAAGPLLTLMRREPSDWLATNAAKTLARSGEAGIVAILEAMADSDPEVRKVAAGGFSDSAGYVIDDERVIRALVESVLDEEAGHGGYAVLHAARSRLAAELLLPMLDDPRASVRACAVQAIWAHDDEDVVLKLKDLLCDPDPIVRTRTAWALKVGDKYDVASALEAALEKESEESVLREIRSSLGSISQSKRRAPDVSRSGYRPFVD